MSFDLPIAIHLASALGALGLGAAVLAMRKGTALHKRLGRAWVGLMAVAALSSYAIQTSGGLSWIHGLSTWVLVCLVVAVVAIRKGRVRTHRRFVTGAYLGLIAAGLGAMIPGRLLGSLLWG